MGKQSQLHHEVYLAPIHRGINVLENPVVSCIPNTPRHENDDFHVEGHLQFILYLSKDVQQWSRCVDRDSNRIPACLGEVAA